MSKKTFVKAATDLIVKLYMDRNVTVFDFDRVIESIIEYPECRRMLRQKIRRVMSRARKLLGVELVPLTGHYFREYSPTDGGWLNYGQPEGSGEVRLCVAGLLPHAGDTVGFMIAGKNLMTGMWRMHENAAAEANSKHAIEVSKKVCESVGFRDIPALERYTKSQLRQLSNESADGNGV